VSIVDGMRLRGNRWLAISPVDVLRTRTRLGVLSDRRVDRLRARRRPRRFRRTGIADPFTMANLGVDPVLDPVGELRGQGATVEVVLIPKCAGRTRHDEQLLDLLEAANVAVLDLHGVVSPSDYFEGDGHWNANGCATAATAVEAFARTLPQGAGDETDDDGRAMAVLPSGES
jgi:hypothetical protein